MHAATPKHCSMCGWHGCVVCVHLYIYVYVHSRLSHIYVYKLILCDNCDEWGWVCVLVILKATSLWQLLEINWRIQALTSNVAVLMKRKAHTHYYECLKVSPSPPHFLSSLPSSPSFFRICMTGTSVTALAKQMKVAVFATEARLSSALSGLSL